MPLQTTDKYANILYDSVTESAANTLTFNEIVLGLNLFDKVGILIHRIEWFGWYSLLVAADDVIQFGLSASNSWAAVVPGETSIITFKTKQIVDFGTAGNNILFAEPLVDDFSNLPGRGILVSPKPIYVFAKGLSLATPATIRMRMFFTVVKMKPEDYFELLESRQYFG